MLGRQKPIQLTHYYLNLIPLRLKFLLKNSKDVNHPPGIDQILTELSQAGGNTLHTEIHKIINSIWNKEELLHQWKECIIVPIFIKGDKTDCSNYRGISLLPTYKILSNIHVSRLTPYRDKIIGDQQCRFQHNRSATDTYILHLLDTGEKVRI
jgi:hypothetical protein